MNRFTGQAGRTLVRVLHGAGMLVMTLFFIVILGAGVLAYRLSLGPLEIPGAASRLANMVSGEDVEVRIGRAELAWAGYKKGSRAPLFLGLGDILVQNPSGAVIATIPEAELAFSLGALFTGRTPIYVSSRNAHVMGYGAPVSLLAGIRLGTAFTLENAEIWVTLGAGQLGPPGLDEPITGGKFLLTITPNDVRLDDAMLTLTPFGQSAPVIHIAAAAHRKNGWHGAITLSAAAVQATDLYHYWPAKLAVATRSWVTTNITAGTAKAARFTLGLSAPLHLASMQIDSATGGFDAENATLIWLPGVQPLTGLNGRFALTDADNILITAQTGRLGGIALTGAQMHIAGVSQADQLASLDIPVSGNVQDVFTVLNGPNLELLKTTPPQVLAATGDMTGTIKVTLPLQGNVSIDAVKMTVATELSNVTLPLPVPGLVLRQGSLAVSATLHNLSIKGDAQLEGELVRLAVMADFAQAKGAPVILDMKTTATPAVLKDLGLDSSSFMHGPMPVTVHVVTSGTQGGTLKVQGDLTPAALALPVFGWTKPAGTPGAFTFAASINGDRFSGIDRIDSIDATAPGLDVESTMAGNTIVLTHVRIGDTQGAGRIIPPAATGQPWRMALTGNALDLSSVVNPQHKQVAAESTPPAVPRPTPARPKLTRPQPPTGFLWDATAHFDRLLLAVSPEPALADFDFQGNGRGDFIFQMHSSAEVEGGGPVTLTVTPVAGTAPAEAEMMQLQTGNGGMLLRAMGAYDDLSGGVLDLSASYGVGLPITGVTKITNFRLLNAPAIGKILQAVTVLGIPEAASGPGLLFSRFVLPFSIDDQVMTLKEARAYSASLGFTASGTIDLGASLYDIHGTVVPAYALNALPGKIPIIGKLFSPEKGGGLFAMRYSMTGPFDDAKIKINPLSAFTPGFLREIFGIGQKPEAK